MLVLALGALAFGIAMLRAKAVPRAVAWLLIAALPVGLPLVMDFRAYVMSESADPWAGPLVFYGFAWIVLGRHFLARGTTANAEIPEAVSQ